MIIDNQTLAYRNVISKIVECTYSEAKEVFENMFKTIDKYNLTPQGNYFYTVLSDIRDQENLILELSIPIEESIVNLKEEDKLNFRSYYFLKNLLMSRIIENFENEGLKKYGEFADYIVENNMIQRTPIVNEFVMTNTGREILNIYLGADENTKTILQRFMKKIESNKINQF